MQVSARWVVVTAGISRPEVHTLARKLRVRTGAGGQQLHVLSHSLDLFTCDKLIESPKEQNMELRHFVVSNSYTFCYCWVVECCDCPFRTPKNTDDLLLLKLIWCCLNDKTHERSYLLCCLQLSMCQYSHASHFSVVQLKLKSDCMQAFADIVSSVRSTWRKLGSLVLLVHEQSFSWPLQSKSCWATARWRMWIIHFCHVGEVYSRMTAEWDWTSFSPSLDWQCLGNGEAVVPNSNTKDLNAVPGGGCMEWQQVRIQGWNNQAYMRTSQR